MSQSVDKKELYAMRYPCGTVIELTEPIEDRYGSGKPVGSRFRVDYADDALQLHGGMVAAAVRLYCCDYRA